MRTEKKVRILKGVLRRPPDAGEREDAACLVVGLVVDLDVMANKGVEAEQAHGDIGAVGLIAGLLGEATGGDVEPAIARAKPTDERAHCGRAHGSLAVLDLRHDARGLEPQRVGGGDHVASAIGALGCHAGAIPHRLEHSCHQALNVFPAELTHTILDELDAVVVGGGERLVVARGVLCAVMGLAKGADDSNGVALALIVCAVPRVRHACA